MKARSLEEMTVKNTRVNNSILENLETLKKPLHGKTAEQEVSDYRLVSPLGDTSLKGFQAHARNPKGI